MKPLTAEDLVGGARYKIKLPDRLEDVDYIGLTTSGYLFKKYPIAYYLNEKEISTLVTPYHEPNECCGGYCPTFGTTCILDEPNQTNMNTDYTEQPFNLETALKHPEWVYFRNGEKPLEWHWFEKYNSEYPLVAISNNNNTIYISKVGFVHNREKLSCYDLILRVPYVTRWINVYPSKTLHDTKEEADKIATENRIACVPVKIPAV